MGLLDDVSRRLLRFMLLETNERGENPALGKCVHDVTGMVLEAAAKTCEHGICEGCNHAECVTVRQRAEAIRALKSPR